MLNNILRLIVGSQNERLLKKLAPVVNSINALEPEIKKASDAELKSYAGKFRERLAQGETMDDILPEAFAVVREASARATGLRHFDVQLIGGLVLHQGKIAEMKTGEGKTLVATLAAYLNALTGLGVHIVTVNDYLARRDRYWMGPIYEFLGLTVGYVEHDMKNETRRQAYLCDVTYVTNNEIGFDYLRDNLVVRQEDRCLRPFNYAIVDEVDSILIDEARTPLIISGPAEESTHRYYTADKVIPYLKGRFITESEEIAAKQKGTDLGVGYDYLVDEKSHAVVLTDSGITKCERILGVQSLYDDIQGEWVHHITQSLRAHNLYKRDVDYVVKDGEVVIVDEFTGRLMPGRRWSDGLHQSVEAKERLKIAEENQTLATITFQNFFKLYKKLAGMTGTAATEAAEFWEIYKLDVVQIPTHRVMVRDDYPDRVFRTEREKNEAIIAELEELWKLGRPVLVGTRSIEKSESLSAMLRRKGVPHQVLNAKYHEQEAKIITQAGIKGTVTIATNMAGRGTDIVLGGNPPDVKQTAVIIKLGGMHVLGTERHESRRIDNQLRGRCGRQGDPGSSRFYLSLEDELLRLFGSERLSGLMGKLGMQEGEDIQHPWITKAIENAQRKVEAMNFDVRKQLLEFDNVMNKQREVIYALRNLVLETEDISERVKDMLNDSLEDKLEMWTPDKAPPDEWNLDGLSAWLKRIFGLEENFDVHSVPDTETLRTELLDKLGEAYRQREASLGQETFKRLERMVLLQIVDRTWVEHLTYLEQLRRGIFLRAYGQKDPVIEFKRESFNLFESMLERLREDAVEYIFRIQIVPQQEYRPAPADMRAVKPEFTGVTPGGANTNNGATSPSLSANIAIRGLSARAGPSLTGTLTKTATSPVTAKKIGRNDPCPCGSGKKYKKCCGA